MMSEFAGNDVFVALQKELLDRAEEFARNPVIVNGGRIMNILDPDAFGWEKLRQVAQRDKFVGLTMVNRDRTLNRLSTLFEERAEFPYWQVFTGTSDEILPKCAIILSKGDLPTGWRLQSYAHPDDDTIDSAQALNMALGVAPLPAYYLRGVVLPSMLTCLYDNIGEMVACAIGTMRHHPNSKLAGWMFAGSVSVHKDHRRKGLGTYVNAALLRDSHAAFRWSHTIEQAKPDNHASVGMITKCGLAPSEDTVTIVINLTNGGITR